MVIKEVVIEPRESKSVRRTIERKSQYEREWLLHITGVIDDGQKGEIRHIYDMRSSIVHDSENDFLKEVNIPDDIDRGMKAINILHRELYGIDLKHRVGDLIA